MYKKLFLLMLAVACLAAVAVMSSSFTAAAKTINCGKVAAGGSKPGGKMTVLVLSGKVSCKKAKTVMRIWAGGPSVVPTKVKGFLCSIDMKKKGLLCTKGKVKIKGGSVEFR